MRKIPKVIQNEADILALKQALDDPDQKVRWEATKKWIETVDPSGQIAKGHATRCFAVLENGLNSPATEERTETARAILKNHDPEGLRLLDKKPKLGIERARKLLRDWKKRFEEKEKSHPPN